MSRVTKIYKYSLPDRAVGVVNVYSNDDQLIGSLEFDAKGVSRWADAPGQQPHRRWPLKRKHRGQ